MFTLGLVYAIIYLYIFMCLLILSSIHLPVWFLTHLSLTNFLIILQKYSRFKTPFLLLVFCLTGLPPVGLFFVKFNIVAFVLYQTHIFSIFGLFFIFFLNMLYYMQLFNSRNFKKPVYSIFNPEIFTIWQQNPVNIRVRNTYTTYKLTFTVVMALLLLFSALLFFSDLFLILNLV